MKFARFVNSQPMCFSLFPRTQAVTYKFIRVYRTNQEDTFRFFIQQLKKNGGYGAYEKKLNAFLDAFDDDLIDFLRMTDHGISVFNKKTHALIFDPAGDMICDGKKYALKHFLTVKKIEGSDEWLEYIASWRERLTRHNRYDEVNQKLIDMDVHIPSSANGMGPDFRLGPKKHVYHEGAKRFDDITIKMSGNREEDFRRAFKAAGLDPDDVIRNSSQQYTWHHLDDFNPETGTCTMQLVHSPIHNALEHAGAVHMWELFWGGGAKMVPYT